MNSLSSPTHYRPFEAGGALVKGLRGWFAVLALLLVFSPVLRAQENATINGTVTDASGAVVANAQLTLTDNATGQVRTETSNSVGAYRFGNLAIGTYTLSATAAGFEKYTKTGIVVNVAQTLEEDISFKIGSATQTVSVEAEALQTQTETSEVSTLISGQQVEQLSTNGRNVTALAALGLGVSNNLPPFSGVDALTSANGISFNGTRTEHNIYLLDGAEQNDRGCGGGHARGLDRTDGRGTITLVLKSGTHDFHGEVYEFNRNTDYDANDYFTKLAGQPRPVFDLNEPGFNIGGPLFIPHVYNNSRNRTFFFWNEEWRRLVQGGAPSVANTIMANNFPTAGTPLTYTIPAAENVVTGGNPLCNPGVQAPCVPATSDPAKLALYKTDGLTIGNNFPGSVIPANLIDPNAVLEVNAGTFPKPNLGTGQYTASIPATDFIREDVVRIDHSFDSKFQLMGHYLHDAMAKSFYPPLWGDSSYPTVGTAMTNPSYTAAIKLTQTYTPTLLNETAFLYSGNKITLTPQAGKGGSFTYPNGWGTTSSGNPAASFFPLADNDLSRMPAIFLQGAPLNTTWDPSYFPWKNGYEGFEYRDDLSWTKGRHQFKFGPSLLHDYKNQQLQFNTNANAYFNSSNFTGDSYLNFLLGDASSFSQLQYLAGKHWVNNNFGAYANDNWHVSTRLTLNLGFRYDGMPHAFERYNQFANFVASDYDSSLGNPVTAAGTLNPASLTTYNGAQFYLNGMKEAGVGGFPRGVVQNDYKTWEPRIGFAYNVLGDGKTVIRGGFGMFYERIQGNDVYGAALNPPFAYIPSATNVYFSNPNTSALTGATTTQTFPANLVTIDYHYPNPGTADFSLGIQRELAPSVVAVVQYVGSDGWNQSDDRHINTLPLTDPTNSAAPYDDREGVANGSLNANIYRIYPGYSDINQQETESNFNYNSLQAGIRVENKHGLTTQVAYTWSHNISLYSNDLYPVSDPFNLKYDRGSDDTFDRRHDLNVSYVYNLPFGKNGSMLTRDTIGGWTISGITVAESGVPQYVTYTGPDVVGLGCCFTNRPNLVSKVSYPKTVAAWYSKSSYADPVAPWAGGPNNGFGNAGKDSAVGPGIFNWNLSLFKAIALNERGTRIELRFETFNTFNHFIPQGVDDGSHDGNFGAVVNDYGPRLMELGGKFVF